MDAWLHGCIRLRFPDRTQPSHPTFATVYCRVAETKINGTTKGDRDSLVRLTTKNAFQRLSEIIQLSAHVKWPQHVMYIILPHRGYFKAGPASILQRVQVLLLFDHSLQETFCRQIIAQTKNTLFVSLVLITDEGTFGRDGIRNLQSQHFWADRNFRFLLRIHQVLHHQHIKICRL